ncbi:MAG: hypothetical protein V4613_00220 [Bacteroidota bacterium]
MPPIVNLPFDKSFIAVQQPQFLQIHFTPRHTITPQLIDKVRYKIRLVEMSANNRNPNEVMQSTLLPFFETVVSQTVFVFGPGDPSLIEGRSYALQIQAIDVDGKDVFENNGYSQIVSFTYGSQCASPSEIEIKDTGGTSASVVWNEMTNARSYMVYYKKKSEKMFKTDVVFSNACLLTQLTPNEVYEVKVTATCSYNESESTDLVTFKTSDGTSAYNDWTGKCGNALPEINLSNSNPLILLQAGEIIEAADFKVRILASTGSNGLFSGTGLVTMPFSGPVPLPCTFENIRINSDKRMIAGKISLLQAPLELSNRSVQSLAKNWRSFFGENWNKNNQVIYDGVIDNIVLDEETGKIIISGSGGKQNLVKGKNYKVEDKQGKVFYISEGGVIVESEGPQTEPVVKVDITGEISPTELPAGMAKLFFYDEPSNGYDAFDISKLTDGSTYDKLECLDTAYNVGWHLAVTGESINVNAKFVQGSKIRCPLDSVFFIRSDGTRLPFLRDGMNFSITAKGRLHLYADAIWAVAKYSVDGKGTPKRWILGKINLINVDAKKPVVKLIPVNGVGIQVDGLDIMAQLKGIYGAYGVLPSVVQGTNLEVSGYSQDEETINAEASLLSNTYNSKLTQFISAYKAKYRYLTESDTSYFFLLNQSSENTDGFMRFGEQFGFLFLNNSSGLSARVLAHEFGHGKLYLEHPFGEDISRAGRTQNLMDYNVPQSLLNYKQWMAIHDPKFLNNLKTSITQKAIEGKIIKNKRRTLADLGIADSGYLKFVQPDGGLITLHSDSIGAIYFSMAYTGGKNEILSNTSKNSIGVVTSFIYKGVSYNSSVYGKQNFSGFYKGDDNFLLIDSFVYRNSKAGIHTIYAGIEKESCLLEICKGNYKYIHSPNRVIISTLTLINKEMLKSIQLKDECYEYFDEENLTEDARKWWQKSQININYKSNEGNCRRIVRLINDLGEEYKYYNVATYDALLKKFPKYYKPYSVNLDEPLKVDGLWSFENYLRLSMLSIAQQEKVFNKINDPEKVFDVLITMNDGVYNQLLLDIRVKALRLLASNGINEIMHIRGSGEETVAVKLINSTPDNQIDQMLDSLEFVKVNGLPLVQVLVDEIDDAVIGMGSDNYFKLMKALTRLVLHSSKVDEKIQQIEADPLKHTIFWSSHFINYGSKKEGDFVYSDIEMVDGKITFSQELVKSVSTHYVNGILYYDYDYSPTTTYTFDSPFDLIYFSNSSDVGMIDAFMQESSNGGLPLVPAVFLKYSDDKTFNQYAGKITAIAVDIATLATGPGIILKTAELARLTRYAATAYEVGNMVAAAGNLTLNLADMGNDTTYAKVVDRFNEVMGVIGLAQLSKTVIKQGVKSVPKIMSNVKTASKTFSKELAASYIASVIAIEADLVTLSKINIHADNILALRKRVCDDWIRVYGIQDYLKYVNKFRFMAYFGMKSFVKLAKNQSASIKIAWRNIDDKQGIWEGPGTNLYATAKAFASEAGDQMYDMVVGSNGFYVKFDLKTSRILLGETDGTYHAFAIIEDKIIENLKTSLVGKTQEETEAIMQYFMADHMVNLKTIVGISRRPILIGDKMFELSTEKVSTFLGSFDPHMEAFFKQIGNYKNIGIGVNKGQINALNMPNQYMYFSRTGEKLSNDEWWLIFNKQWLNDAISRKDDVYLVTPISPGLLVKIYKNKIPQTIFAYELKHLVVNGYKPINMTLDEFKVLELFFK